MVQTEGLSIPPNIGGEEEQRETDMRLYADYERMYKRAAELAYEATCDVIESQRYDAYITELAVRLCEMSVPEEEAFIHEKLNNACHAHITIDDISHFLLDLARIKTNWFSPSRSFIDPTYNHNKHRYIFDGIDYDDI